MSNTSGRISQMVLADVTFDVPPPLPDDSITFILSLDNAFSITALRRRSEGTSVQKHRIIVGIPSFSGTPSSAPPTSYIQKARGRMGPRHIEASSSKPVAPTPSTISQTHWSTRIRTHSAVADTFYVSK
ncbi:hypothetical protein AcW1_005922 [Taiwanofungus camphoratus]|nr:hypothetical protein AcW2_004674 [Antrodia cinnamomea]KAI0934382.1 hypothetical protein AcV5_006238 [Antrodia cinnamomea]KAI0950330.1 hypothetical protein AcV7_008834 [Antrodia cinnamomea]KAI0957576.1 hypothetical protein AcW1_005922 [Antrodia cinnamomea]